MIRFSLSILATAWMLAAASPEARAGDIIIDTAWARASVGRTGAAFVTFANRGKSTDRLVSVASPFAANVMLHRSFEDGGVMRMEHVPEIAVAAEQRVEMKPGGLHIMLINLKQPLVKGGTFPMTLQFENSGKIEVTVTIHGPGDMAPK